MTDPYIQTDTGLYVRPDIRANDTDVFKRPSAWSPMAGWGGKTLAGERMGPTSAMSLPAYFAAIRAIAEDVGKLPLITYERTGPRSRERAVEHPYYSVLRNETNRDMTAMTFRETLTAWALGWGNGFAEIERTARGDMVAMWPIHPSRIPPWSIRRNDEGEIVYDVYQDAGVIGRTRDRQASIEVIPIRASDMLHIRGLGHEGLYGLSVAQIAAENLGINLAAQTFAAAFFGNGMNVGSILEHPAKLSDTAVTHLRESWAERYSGPQNASKPVILEEGMKFQRLGIPPNEAQFIETRQFGIEDIARLFRIPPHKIQHLLRATFSNVEQQALEYVIDCLQPWLTRWEQELDRRLFRGDRIHFAEHLVSSLLRGDMKTRAEYMWRRFTMGSLSPDDIRALENENPTGTEAGSRYYIPANMGTLDEISERRGGSTSGGTSRRERQAKQTVAHQNGHQLSLEDVLR